MIVVDPVTLGDTSLSGGGGSYYDKNGTLQTAAPGTPRLTYDPADLSKPPALMLEPAAENQYLYSEDFTNSAWSKTGCGIAPGSGVAPNGASTATALIEGTGTGAYLLQNGTANAGGVISQSVFAKRGDGARGIALILVGAGVGGINQIISFDLENYEKVTVSGTLEGRIEKLPQGWVRLSVRFVSPAGGAVSTQIRLTKNHGITYAGDGASWNLIWGAMLTMNGYSSYVKTNGAPVTRAADIVGSIPGLLYSNVAETEQVWVAGTTYAKDAIVRVGHTVYQSLVASNVGNDPTLAANASKWLKLGATNRWAMFDDRNNTQTTSPQEIVVVLSPRAIAQGLLLGNTDATEIGVSVTVPNYGVVYSEISSMVVSTSRSSFFRWAFNRIKRRSLFLTLKLPLFFNGVVTVTIRRPGGVAKCGMCMIGPTINNGLTLMGLSTEIKDYSTTLFNTDGSSETTPRGYRKLMSMDVSIDTEDIVEVEEQMIAWRQKNVVWIGSPARLDTVAVGRYSSFKKVIESFPRSKMALQIEGVLS